MKDVIIDYKVFYPALLQAREVGDGVSMKENQKYLNSAWNEVKNEIPKIRTDLEVDLRNIIGS